MNAQESKGLWLGLAGVTIFALTLPMTRLAVGTPEAPQMSGVFIALGRAVVAALLSVVFLLATRAPLPRREDWLPLAITSGGVVFGFPLLTSMAMRHVEAVHASVIVGVLPLATAAVGAWLHRQRPSAGLLGLRRAGQRAGGGLRGAALRPKRLGDPAGRRAAAGGDGLRRRRLRLGRSAVAAHARRARDLLGAGDRAAAHRCRRHC